MQYTSYLCFTFGTNFDAPHAYGISVFLLAFLYKFMLFELRFKDAAGTIDHAQIALASPGQSEA